jgi:hypothetical protein
MEFVFYSRITPKQLENRYIEHWKTLLFNDDNKSGGNKLRTYRKLKTQFDLTPELHNLHILSSAGVFKYLPFSIFKLLLLILILTNVDIDLSVVLIFYVTFTDFKVFIKFQNFKTCI